MGTFVKEFRQCLLFRTPYCHSLAIYYLGHIGILVVHVADENRLRRTNNNACWFKSHVDAMCAKVALLRRVIFRIDEDSIVRTSGYAGLAADANRFVKIDDAIRAFEHCRRGAGNYTWCASALVATRNLMHPTHLWKDSDVDVLYVSSSHRQGHKIL